VRWPPPRRSRRQANPTGILPLLSDKVALVTGGASGIGRAAAFAFAREGAKVVIGDIDAAGCENTIASIKSQGGEATYLLADVTMSADIRALVAKAVTDYGGLDCAFNNAGLVGSVAGIVDTPEEDWNRILATNLTGVWLCMKYEIPEMLRRGGGAISLFRWRLGASPLSVSPNASRSMPGVSRSRLTGGCRIGWPVQSTRGTGGKPPY
jgi:NAD(P)-dependent dehydrogenase (short-subunit alcohol dehydrogenase family)